MPDKQPGVMVRTVKAVKYALVNHKGVPQWATGSVDHAIGIFAQINNDIVLDEESRMRAFDKMTRKGWSIRSCVCEVEVSSRRFDREEVKRTR